MDTLEVYCLANGWLVGVLPLDAFDTFLEVLRAPPIEYLFADLFVFIVLNAC